MTMKRWWGVAVALAILAPSGTGFAQSAEPSLAEEVRALRKEIESLKEMQLKTLEVLTRSRAAASQAGQATAPRTDVAVSIDKTPVRGSESATVTLIEFSDYHCPFCARYFRETWPQLDAKYIQTGKVRYVFKDTPIESLHPQAFKAHEAARCAGEQGKYWEMHDRLFADQKDGIDAIPRHAEAIALDLARFKQCFDSGKPAADIRASIADAGAVGISGTPTFMLGLTEPNSGKVRSSRCCGAPSRTLHSRRPSTPCSPSDLERRRFPLQTRGADAETILSEEGDRSACLHGPFRCATLTRRTESVASGEGENPTDPLIEFELSPSSLSPSASIESPNVVLPSR
jgi:protein-disulfide isomerase